MAKMNDRASELQFDDNYSNSKEMRQHYNNLIRKHNLSNKVTLVPIPNTVNGIRGANTDLRGIEKNNKVIATTQHIRMFEFDKDKKKHAKIKGSVLIPVRKHVNDKQDLEGIIYSVPRKTVLLHEVGHFKNRDTLRQKVKRTTFKTGIKLSRSDSKFKTKVLLPHVKYTYHLLGEFEEKSANKFVKKELRDMGYSREQIKEIELKSKLYKTPYTHKKHRKSAYDNYFKNILSKEEKKAFEIVNIAYEKI